jgi:hypothetical protein
MAAIALSTLRSRLRVFLDDTNSKNWPVDAHLNLFINMAIIKYTTDMPISSVKVYTVADDAQADNHTYILPTDLVTDLFLRGQFDSAEYENVARLNFQYGEWITGSEPKGYFIDHPSEGYLYLPREPESTTFSFYYGACYEDTLESDSDSFDFGRNKWGEQAVYAYAAYLAFNPSSSARAQLEQWARKGDQRVGNPLEEEADRWLQIYRDLIEDHAEIPTTWEFSRAGKG